MEMALCAFCIAQGICIAQGVCIAQGIRIARRTCGAVAPDVPGAGDCRGRVITTQTAR